MRKHFSEYFRPAEIEKKVIWAEAVFVFDTNVLLNLYRVSRDMSLAIVNTLKALQGRLFLPHQVGVEFYKHREEEIAKQVNAFERVRQALKGIPEQFKKDFSRHPCIPIAGIIDALKICADEQIVKVTESQNANQLNFLIHEDPIQPELDTLFAGVSEGPCSGEDDDALNKKVEERVQQNLPPCYVFTGGKASVPTASNPHRSDGRLWFQIVEHAARIKKSVIFVTADQKANWWRTAKLGNEERPIGPHFQLIRDVESASRNRFMMYTQEEFLSEAPKYLGVPEQTQAIEELKQIQEGEAMENDLGPMDEKTSPLEELRGREKDGSGAKGELMGQDVGSMDEPKLSPHEESKSWDKAESKGEGVE